MINVYVRIEKILFAKEGFHIISCSPLLNLTPDQIIDINDKYNTFSIKGNNLESIATEGMLANLTIKPIQQTESYGTTYQVDVISNSYPENPILQRTLLESYTDHLKQDYHYKKYRDDISIILGTLREDYDAKDDTPYEDVKELSQFFTANVRTGIQSLRHISKWEQFLQPFELSTKAYNRIYEGLELLNPKTDNIIENPYKAFHAAEISLPYVTELYVEIYNKVSKTALPPTDPYLCNSIITYYLKQHLVNTSNTIMEIGVLIDTIMQNYYAFFNNDPTFILKILDNDTLPKKGFTKLNNTYVTTPELYFAEHTIHKALVKNIDSMTKILSPNKTINHDALDHSDIHKLELFDIYLKENNLILSEEQLLFCHLALIAPMVFLTGEAGTGKSYTLGILIGYLKNSNAIIKCAAPTASAATTLHKYAKVPTTTAHSMIARDEDVDIIILDEWGMADDYLMTDVIEYTNMQNARVIFAGDFGQLLPVGPGAPFTDVLTQYSELFVKLTKVYRQSNPDLLDNLLLARNGEFNVYDKSPNHWTLKDNIIAYKQLTGYDEALNLIYHTYQEYGNSMDNIGVIAPLNKTIKWLNIGLQLRINPITGRNVKTDDYTYCKDDLIILGQNRAYINADKIIGESVIPTYGVEYDIHQVTEADTVLSYNGAQGKVIQVLNEYQFIVSVAHGNLLFDSRITGEDLGSIYDISLNYARTTHKAQGAQYDYLVAIVEPSRVSMTSRRMIYTILSRAKSKIVIMSSTNFSNIDEVRLTVLSQRIFFEKDVADDN